MDHHTTIRVSHNNEAEYWKSKYFELEGNFWQVKSELQTRFEVGRSQYSVLHFDFEKMNKEFVQAKKKVETLTVGNNVVRDELRKSKTLCEELNEGFKKKLSDLETQVALKDKYGVEMEGQLEAYKNKYDECQKIHEGFRIKVSDLETQLDLKDKYGVDMKGQLEVYKNKYDECQNMNEGFKIKVSDLETQLDLKLKNELDIKGKLETYQSKYDALYEELLEKTRELNDHISNKMSVVDKFIQLRKELKELEAGKKRVEDEVEDLKTKLENQAAMWQNIGAELRKELEVYRDKCVGLSIELKEKDTERVGFEGQLKDKEMECVGVEAQLKSLLSVKVALNEEIEKYKTKCTELQKQKLGLVEEKKVIVEREIKAQKRITYLKEILKRMESGEEEALAHAKTENLDTMFGERTAEDGSIKKLTELETRVLKLEEEKSTLTIQIKEFERISKEFGIQADLRLKYELNLEKKFEDYKTKHDGLCASYKKKKARCIFLENELERYKSLCELLKEQVKSLEEEKKAFSVKEKTQQEKITCVEEDNRILVKSDETDKCVQLNEKIADLECEKRRATDETGVLKTKCRELESQAELLKNNGIGLGKELEICQVKCNGLSVALKEKEMKCAGFEHGLKNLMLVKVTLDNELEGCKTAFSELKEQFKDLVEDRKLSCEKEKNSQQRITYLEELVKNIESDERELKVQILRLQKENSSLRCLDSRDNREGGFELTWLQDKVKTNITKKLPNEIDSGANDAKVALSAIKGGQHVSGLTSTNEQYKPFGNEKKEKNNSQFESTVKVELCHELEGSSSEKLQILEQVNGSKDDEESAPNYTYSITVKETDRFANDVTFKSPSDDGKNLLTSLKGLKRPLANQRCEEYESICKENTTLVPLASISKRSRSVETVITGTESMVKSDDTIPVGSRKSLISLRQCQEEKQYLKSTLINHLHVSKNPYQKVGNPICKNEKENVVEETGYESEGQYGEIRVQCSYSSGSQDSSSDSEDSSDIGWSSDQALAMMKRNRLKESKWQFEADMLSSLEEDPELCMKAVCALHRQKFPMEKLMNGSSHSNNRGFSGYDALRWTTLAEFLTNGDPKGDLKKSVKDLEMFDPKALENCKRLATNYSKQLFSIYQRKEDPFFLPS